MKLFLSLFVFIGLAGVVLAMHEADHRYTVSGHVRNEQGEPRSGFAVVVEHKGGEKKQIKTDSAGFYEAVFHLHNENLGDDLIITAGTEVKRVVLAFDPEDKFTHRGGEVDFGPPGREARSVYWFLAGGGVLLVCAALSFSLFKKKKSGKKAKHKK